MTFVVTLFMSFVVMLAVIAGMSLGVLNGRRPIRGSCGGVNGGSCELCSEDGVCRRREQSRGAGGGGT